MVIIGVDPSLRSTGVAVIDTNTGDVRSCHIVTDEGLPLSDTLLSIFVDFTAFCEKVTRGKRGVIAGVEGFSFASSGNAAVQLGAVGGIIRLACRLSGFKLVDVSPTTWRAIVLGSGKWKPVDATGNVVDKKTRIGSSIIRELLLTRFGVELFSVDECEAYLIAKSIVMSLDGCRTKSALNLRSIIEGV